MNLTTSSSDAPVVGRISSRYHYNYQVDHEELLSFHLILCSIGFGAIYGRPRNTTCLINLIQWKVSVEYKNRGIEENTCATHENRVGETDDTFYGLEYVMQSLAIPERSPLIPEVLLSN